MQIERSDSNDHSKIAPDSFVRELLRAVFRWIFMLKHLVQINQLCCFFLVKYVYFCHCLSVQIYRQIFFPINFSLPPGKFHADTKLMPHYFDDVLSEIERNSNIDCSVRYSKCSAGIWGSNLMLWWTAFSLLFVPWKWHNDHK